ncbi:hypothetical protein ACFSL4_14515 [Streptomyces caeni]|uniref:Globin n=1 Tax=Streptomyces caeni TaxID=2307231 RepID=A0ABW4IQ04_9ACTN
MTEQSVVDGKHAPDKPGTPTFYEWAGGDEALGRLAEVFYGHVLKDPLLVPLFADMDKDHPKHVAKWLAEVFGGPTATPPSAEATRTWRACTSAEASPRRSAAAG